MRHIAFRLRCSYDVGLTIKDAVKNIADSLQVKDREALSQWLYIFTKVVFFY